MPQDSRHPQYAARIGQWVKCRDSVNGEEAIKQKRTRYLRAPSGMPDRGAQGGITQFIDGDPGFHGSGSGISQNDYDTYLSFADWFGAAERTVDGFLGLVFRKPIEITYPDEWRTRLEPHLNDITNTGLPLNAFCSQLMKELLTTSRVGILVDQPSEDTPPENRRPHWKSFEAEAIINWNSSVRLGNPEITQVILEGSELRTSQEDRYQKERAMIWHELALNEIAVVQVGENTLTAPRYTMIKWEKTRSGSNEEMFVARERVVPTRFGSPLPFIPFTFINATDLDVAPPKPDLLSLANKCLSYYQTSADYKWGLHWTMLKTLFIIGPDLKETRIRLGGTAVQNIATRDDTQIQLVEPNGSQSEVLLKQLDSVKAEMAVLGSRLLSPQSASGVEAAETVAWRHLGEQSVLQSRVNMLSMGVTKALREHCYWMGLTEDVDDERVSVEINRDFLPVGLSPQMVMSLIAGLQAGVLTPQDMHHQLSQGEVLAPEHVGQFDLWQERREEADTEILTDGFVADARNRERQDIGRDA